MDALRRTIADLNREIERSEEAVGEVVESARESVHGKRAEMQPTQPFVVAEVPPSDDNAPTRTTPTVRRRARSPKCA
jgi:hypothetical protein